MVKDTDTRATLMDIIRINCVGVYLRPCLWLWRNDVPVPTPKAAVFYKGGTFIYNYN